MRSQTNGRRQENTIMVLPFHIQFRQRDLRFFLNVQKVQRVFEKGRLTPFLDPSGTFQSLFDAQGTAVPVVDLIQHLEARAQTWPLEEAPPSAKHPRLVSPPTHERIIVSSVLGHLIGVLVSRTKKIERIPNGLLKPPPALVQSEESLVQGVLQDELGYRYMLNIEGFLARAALGGLSAQEAGTPPPKAGLEGRRILMVEDSNFFIRLASDALSKVGVRVEVAQDGRQGLKRLLEDGPFDLALVDIEMPIMNGIEMIRRYKSERPDSTLPILFHSSITNETLFRDIQEENLGVCIGKFSETALIEALRGTLKRPKAA